MLDVRGDVPEPFVISVPIARVGTQIGVPLGPEEIAGLVEPIGFKVLEPVHAGVSGAGYGAELAGDRVTVLVPTNRPDVRPEPFGVDDVIEEIARVFGYTNIPRHVPTWPQPGGITALQRSRRFAKDVLCGVGASEGWTDTFVSEAAHRDVGLTGEAVRVSNPLDAEKPFLRRTLMPGLLGALAYNADRRQPDVRLFEVGVVFSHPEEGVPRIVERAGAGGTEMAELPGERELLSAVFAQEGDDARQAVASWDVLSDAFRLDRVRLVPPGVDDLPPLPGLHPTRSAYLVARGAVDGLEGFEEVEGNNGSNGTAAGVVIGSVGEIDPDVATKFGLTRPTGSGSGSGAAARRIGWLEVDLGLLFDETARGPADHGGRRGQPVPLVGHRPGVRGGGRASRRRRGRRLGGSGGRSARVGPALRRLPRPRHRAGGAQPGLPTPLRFTLAHADRRGGGDSARRLHRGGRAALRGGLALSATRGQPRPLFGDWRAPPRRLR